MEKGNLCNFSLRISTPRNCWLPYYRDPAHCLPPTFRTHPGHTLSLCLLEQDISVDQQGNAQTPGLMQTLVVSTFSAHSEINVIVFSEAPIKL